MAAAVGSTGHAADWVRQLGKGRGDLPLSAWAASWVDGGGTEQDGEFRRRTAMKLDGEFSLGMLTVMRSPSSGRSRCQRAFGDSDL